MARRQTPEALCQERWGATYRQRSWRAERHRMVLLFHKNAHELSVSEGLL
jgi:hypothetical protein